jgi:hypothetical protein
VLVLRSPLGPVFVAQAQPHQRLIALFLRTQPRYSHGTAMRDLAVETEKENLFEKLLSLRRIVQKTIRRNPTDTDDAIGMIRELRQLSTEEMNQILHESLILSAVEHLSQQGRIPPGASLHWNPRQTGDATEPDLEVRLKYKVLISAEASASLKPKGSINTRMAATLQKLSRMKGQLFYVVATPEMERCALTKIGKKRWNIQVLMLGDHRT